MWKFQSLKVESVNQIYYSCWEYWRWWFTSNNGINFYVTYFFPVCSWVINACVLCVLTCWIRSPFDQRCSTLTFSRLRRVSFSCITKVKSINRRSAMVRLSKIKVHVSYSFWWESVKFHFDAIPYNYEILQRNKPATPPSLLSQIR